MINLDKQFSIILEKFKLIENSLNNMNNIDSNELIKLNREYSELRPIVGKIQEYKNLQKDIINLNELVKDNDLSKFFLISSNQSDQNFFTSALNFSTDSFHSV